jgi:hypothetical protein
MNITNGINVKLKDRFFVEDINFYSTIKLIIFLKLIWSKSHREMA